MRLIDATDLINRITKKHGLTEVILDIDESPTIDAVEVVRCKDCVWHEYEEPGAVWCPHVIGSWVKNGGYCFIGQRRD